METKDSPWLRSRASRLHLSLFTSRLRLVQWRTILLELHAEGRLNLLVCRTFLYVVLNIAFVTGVLFDVAERMADANLTGDVESQFHCADGLWAICSRHLDTRDRSNMHLSINDALVGPVQEGLGVNFLVLLIVHRLGDIGAGLAVYAVNYSVEGNDQSLQSGQFWVRLEERLRHTVPEKRPPILTRCPSSIGT